jgi:hypothetical protein
MESTTKIKLKKMMTCNTSSKDYVLESQSTIRYRPTKMTLREYDKKMMNLQLGLKYWQLVLSNDHEWDRKDPVLDPRGILADVNEIKQTGSSKPIYAYAFVFLLPCASTFYCYTVFRLRQACYCRSYSCSTVLYCSGTRVLLLFSSLLVLYPSSDFFLVLRSTTRVLISCTRSIFFL